MGIADDLKFTTYGLAGECKMAPMLIPFNNDCFFMRRVSDHLFQLIQPCHLIGILDNVAFVNLYPVLIQHPCELLKITDALIVSFV